MKAVVFDLFETLITEWGHEKYTKRKMTEDLDIPYEVFIQEWERLHVPMYIGEYDFKTALRYVLSKMNVVVSEEKLEYVEKKRILTKSQCFENIDSRVLDMLSSLKLNGYKLGLISNCSSEEVTVLKNNVLYTYFDHVILSYEVKCAKPDPMIYQYSMKELNVLPEQCLYIGDGGSDELNGAKKAGMLPMQATWYIKDYNKDYTNPFGFTCLQQPSEVVDFLERKRY